MTLPTTKGHNVENDIKEFIKNAVRFFEGQEYMDYPTTLEEAVEIVRTIVNDTLDDHLLRLI